MVIFTRLDRTVRLWVVRRLRLIGFTSTQKLLLTMIHGNRSRLKNDQADTHP